ncbi:transcription initiation factor IIA subunit 1-like isoform X2 [Varroa jacobsoni]|uniref:Transcription initiation factor IIA subunit 1 n=1 Tax=Varroa destructor TaxID=109461 RepID=A0A7M7KIP1_VARDE|nr:transcription initiation factor IIA subunit 1-like [Varroa destructor]XP_022688039.1 transcription initiation factor IIA subunit 1-like isoform X2 [Varroa jacobsoni]
MSSTNVARIYKSVIEDVITGVKDAFLDEGVDEQVLQELKQLWEKKLTESKAIEPVEPPVPLVKVNTTSAPAAAKQLISKSIGVSKVAASTPKAEPGVLQPITVQRNPPPVTTEQFAFPQMIQSAPVVNPQIIHYSGAGVNVGGAVGSMAAPQTVANVGGVTGPITIRMPTASTAGATLPLASTTGAITLTPEMTAQLLNSSNNALSSAQMQAIHNVMLTRQQIARSTGQAQYTITVPMQQMAGAGGPVTAGPVTQMAVAGGALGTPVTLATAQQLQQQMANQQQVAGATQQLRLGRLPGQTDGAMIDSSDSSDSSEDERLGAEEDDRDELDDEDDDRAEHEVDEEPLNSADDVSDEEVSEVQEIDNVVVCQYDKISRSRNRWKFNLKDGIMNIQGRDYVFQKSVGDAEW